MTFRKRFKRWLYGSCPGFAGSFHYFGTRVYFPKNSLIFHLACEQGIYERENIAVISTLVKPGSVYFDVGANIGLTSIPVLINCPDSTVVSIEPSPHVVPFLQRTAEESRFKERWRIISKALGETNGQADFYASSGASSAYDGLRDTKRAKVTKTTIQATTLDVEWEAMSRPPVSVIKIDIEGAETQALRGAASCIKHEQPFILLEWNPVNLKAYNYDPETLLTIAEDLEYCVLSLPTISPVTSPALLKLHMLQTERFSWSPAKELSMHWKQKSKSIDLSRYDLTI